MHDILRRLRGVLIAIVALTLSASLTFGAQPASSAAGLGKAASHSGKTVPNAGAGDETAGGDEDTEPAEDETADDTSDGADNCATDPTGLTAEELAAMSHGSIVCWAAHQDTPEGYDNHGAWVSHWAQMGTGADAAAAGKANGKGHSGK